jgi:hypothetical protein
VAQVLHAVQAMVPPLDQVAPVHGVHVASLEAVPATNPSPAAQLLHAVQAMVPPPEYVEPVQAVHVALLEAVPGA